MSIFHRFRQTIKLNRLRRMGLLNKGSSVNDRGGNVRRFFEYSPLIRSIMFILLFAVLLFSFLGHPEIIEVPDLPEGMASYTSIYARKHVRIEDTRKTEEKRKETRKSIPLYYRLNLSNQKKLLDEYDHFLENLSRKSGKLGRVSGSESRHLLPLLKNPAAASHVRSRLKQFINRGYITLSERLLDPGERICIVDEMNRNRDNGLLTRGNITTSADAALAITDETADLFLPQGERHEFIQTMTPVLQKLMEPFAMKLDMKYTDAMRRLKERQVAPVMRDIQPGENLLMINERVTGEKKAVLDAYREVLAKETLTACSPREILNVTAVAMVLMAFFLFYLFLMHPVIWNSNRKLAILVLILSVSVLLDMAGVFFFVRFQEILSFHPWLLFIALPLGYAPLVLTPILGKEAGFFAGIVSSLAAAVASKGSFDILVLGMMLGVFIPYAVRKCSNYRNFLSTGFVVNALVILLCGTVLGGFKEVHFAVFERWFLVLPFLTALGTVVVAQVTLYLMDYLFDMETDMSLHLFIAGDHPLLRQLQLEAPGTYHHSLMVSLLVENACRAIGANPLLARVGALFHDVGKIRYPEYFTENGSTEDKYKDLTPRSSALFIINHVKAGLELASEYHLKRALRHIIEQHHGTDVVYYFYKKAKDSGEAFDENDFHYKGPKPRSREAAVVSLADACEAAARSLDKPTHGRITELVGSIFMNRLNGGQLDESELTFREMTVVRECFIKTLTSMHHARIAYPKQDDGKEKEIAHEGKQFVADR